MSSDYSHRKSIQILSDLHLERHADKPYTEFDIPCKAPYLALLGDIGNPKVQRDQFTAFIAKQLESFSHVLFVPGNHESYLSSWDSTREVLNDIAVTHPKFIILDRVAFHPPQSPGTVILGCSLFSHVPEERRRIVGDCLNDFHLTKDWVVSDHNAAHKQDLDWLNTKVAELESKDEVKKIIILTHWSPSTDPRAKDPKHAGSPFDIGSAFSTDLSGERCFTSSKMKVWVWGHTHWNCDFQVARAGAGPLRLVANQKGYTVDGHDECVSFDVEKTVDL